MAITKGRPVIHKLDDPTGIAGLRGRALTALKKRCRVSESAVKQYARGVFDRHLVGIETNRVNYIYEYAPDAEARTLSEIKRIIYRAVLGFDDPMWSVNWWMNTYIRSSAERGTADSLRSAKGLAPASVVGQETSIALRSIQLEDVLNQPHYRRRLNAAYGRTFNEMVSFCDVTAKQVSGVLGQAIVSGENYRSVAKDVNKVFDDMAGYRSLRIVRTELNKINTDAHSDNSKQLNKDVFADGGFEVAVMHLSALAINTRNTHGRRHGHVFDIDEQNEWWDSGSNRINCQCSIADVLRDKRTGEVLQTALHKKALEQGRMFFGG